MVNILVTGSDGQLGSEITELAQSLATWAKFDFTTIDNLDITDAGAVEKKLAEKQYHYLINCSAYTAVDKAESDRAAAFAVNSEAVAILATECRKRATRVIHVSTDYVFDGKSYKPYNDNDKTEPQSVYGESKLEGETRLLALQPDSVIIRTAWLYSSFGNNFVKTMQKLGRERESLNVVADQIGTPTYAADLAKCIMRVIEKSALDNYFVPGVYHYTNEGVASWYDFSIEIMELSGLNCMVRPIPSSEYKTAATRPHYSVLDKNKIKNTYGIDIPHWKESLKQCIRKISQTAY